MLAAHGLRRISVNPPALLRSLATQPLHPLFKHWEVQPSVHRIEERFFDSWNKANIFFVRGEDRDLLVDTGTGIHDLPKYLSWTGLRSLFTEKPLTVILTHLHFDHSGGIHQFHSRPNVTTGIHCLEREDLARGHSIKTAAWVTGKEVDAKPKPDWNPKEYRVIGVETNLSLNEGDEIQLGSGPQQTYRILHLPGHSAGSIGLLNAHSGILFSGDILYKTDSELIDWYPGSSVGQMRASVERIRSLDLELVLPGHNEVIESGTEAKLLCDRHLDMATLGRKVAKAFSRARARTILELNQRLLTMPEYVRVMMQR